jgi:hypothetical protein
MALTRRAAGVLLVLLAGCGGHEASRDGAASARGATSSRDAAAIKPACPKTGHWTECQVFARLDQAGVAPRRDSVLADLPAIGVRPLRFRIGTSGLAVYLFADTAMRARAARALDTLHFVAPSASLTMRGEATAIENGNLLGLLYSRNDQQRERVSNALMAGAPQP